MATLLAFPILILLIIIQTGIVGNITLLNGTADLILLTLIAWALQEKVRNAWVWCLVGGLLVSMETALPLGLPLITYGIIVGLTLLLRRRTWQIPIVAMLGLTFIGTIINQALSILALKLSGNPLNVNLALSRIMLPSIILNLILAIPFFVIFNELAKWLYPELLEA